VLYHPEKQSRDSRKALRPIILFLLLLAKQSRDSRKGAPRSEPGSGA